FVTAFAGRHYRDPFAVALLSTTYCIMNLFFILIFLYAKSKKIANPDFFKNKGRDIYSVISFIAIVAAIPLAYVNTYTSFTIFLIIFGWHLIKRKWQ
ncbi:MAG: hypothetical protein ABIO04_08895, partial [Ferruginibacter sp.]